MYVSTGFFDYDNLGHNQLGDLFNICIIQFGNQFETFVLYKRLYFPNINKNYLKIQGQWYNRNTTVANISQYRIEVW